MRSFLKENARMVLVVFLLHFFLFLHIFSLGKGYIPQKNTPRRSKIRFKRNLILELCIFTVSFPVKRY